MCAEWGRSVCRQRAVSVFVLFLFVFPIVFAAEGGGVVNDNKEFWAKITQDGDYLAATQANATIYNPSSTVFLENYTLTNVATGQYVGNFTPNTAGTWYVSVCFYDSGVLLGCNAETYEVLDYEGVTGMSAVAAIIGLVFLSSVLFFLAYRHSKMSGLQKLIAPFFHLVGIWTIGLPLLYISNANIIDPVGDIVLVIYLVFMITYTLIYTGLTILLNTKDYMLKTSSDAFRRIKNG